MAETARHVVLAKRDDVLVIGNVGPYSPEQAQRVSDYFEALGIRVILFAEDIDLAALPQG